MNPVLGTYTDDERAFVVSVQAVTSDGEGFLVAFHPPRSHTWTGPHLFPCRLIKSSSWTIPAMLEAYPAAFFIIPSVSAGLLVAVGVNAGQ